MFELGFLSTAKYITCIDFYGETYLPALSFLGCFIEINVCRMGWMMQKMRSLLITTFICEEVVFSFFFYSWIFQEWLLERVATNMFISQGVRSFLPYFFFSTTWHWESNLVDQFCTYRNFYLLLFCPVLI